MSATVVVRKRGALIVARHGLSVRRASERYLRRPSDASPVTRSDSAHGRAAAGAAAGGSGLGAGAGRAVADGVAVAVGVGVGVGRSGVGVAVAVQGVGVGVGVAVGVAAWPSAWRSAWPWRSASPWRSPSAVGVGVGVGSGSTGSHGLRRAVDEAADGPVERDGQDPAAAVLAERALSRDGHARRSRRRSWRVGEVDGADRGGAVVAVDVAPEQRRQARVADDVAADDRAEAVARVCVLVSTGSAAPVSHEPGSFVRLVVPSKHGQP